jgi:hypothetical protein
MPNNKTTKTHPPSHSRTNPKRRAVARARDIVLTEKAHKYLKKMRQEKQEEPQQ